MKKLVGGPPKICILQNQQEGGDSLKIETLAKGGC